jgi:hypothetical protein
VNPRYAQPPSVAGLMCPRCGSFMTNNDCRAYRTRGVCLDCLYPPVKRRKGKASLSAGEGGNETPSKPGDAPPALLSARVVVFHAGESPFSGPMPGGGAS